ncbi:MAG: zinc ribbon domain-containing protein, partial [Lachnospirales bacterium]
HPAIIPKDLYMLVQEELVRRRVVHTSPSGKKHSYSGNHCFSQIVFCGECGEMYRRIHWNNRGCKSIVWRCISRVERTDHVCHSRTVNELLLQEIVLKAINQTLCDKENLIKTLQENIAKAVRACDATSADGIDERLNELQHELLKKANKKEEYDTVADEIFRLRELKKQSETDTVTRDEKLNRITDLQDFITSQPTEISEFDEQLVKRLIGKITVFEDRFLVEFKSGVNIDI